MKLGRLQELIALLDASDEDAHHAFAVSLLDLAHHSYGMAEELLHSPSAVLQSLRCAWMATWLRCLIPAQAHSAI